VKKGENDHTRSHDYGADTLTFEEVYARFAPRLTQYARRVVLNDDKARDIIQEVFCKLLEDLKVLDQRRNIKSYLFTATHNACLNSLKHLKVEKKYLEAFTYEMQSQELYLIDFWELEEINELGQARLNKVKQAIDQLPPQCREVFLMSRLQQKKNKEIAAEKGIHVKSVEKHISKAMKLIKEMVHLVIWF
jgi:RNA polymerase sigma-70 factor (ECF subfamily)